MNRTGLVIAFALAAAVGLVFGMRPDLDLKLAALFFDPERGGFWRAYDPTYLRARDAALEIGCGPGRLMAARSCSCC